MYSMMIPNPRQYPDRPAAGGMSPIYQQVPAMGVPLPTLPTGMPLGPSPGGIPGAPVSPALPSMPVGQPMGVSGPPQSLTESYFTAGFLRTQIGRRMRVEFLIGTSGPLVDRTGMLVGVGTSYILLRPDGTNITIMADLFSIKFATIYPSGEPAV